MNDAASLILAGCAGVLIGTAYFGGLWWTVRRGLDSHRPALWFLGSLVVRTGISLAGFYFVAGGRWDRLLMCLLGFVIARFVATRFFGPRMSPDSSRVEEVGHAP